jgi:hypothetical protein
MVEGATVEFDVHFMDGRRGRERLRNGRRPKPPPVPEGHVPRVSRLMALAVRFERLIEEGHVRDYAQIARLGHVTRARLTQIMDLRLLAPNIQEELLFLPRVRQARDAITERALRPLVARLDWGEQRRMWRSLKAIEEAG